MENHGLGTHNDKIWADSLIRNAPNTPQFIWLICPHQPIIWDIFKKISHHTSIVHGVTRHHERPVDILCMFTSVCYPRVNSILLHLTYLETI